MQKKQKVLLAFSGGLDTMTIALWLKEEKNLDVIGYCSDLGYGPDPKTLQAKARDLGITELIFEDLKDPFCRDFVFPLIRASAIYQDEYLLGTAVARPLISERSAYWAKKIGADFISHGATGKGNDQLRFERSWARLVPDISVLAPWKIWAFKGRKDLIAYLKGKGFEVDAESKKFSVDTNLFHRSCEGGILESIEGSYDPAEVYEWTKPPARPLPAPEEVLIGFEKGLPVTLNGTPLAAVPLLETLNGLGARHGVGVVDIVEERVNGIKSRGVYETPGGTLLHKALRSLKHLCWDKMTLQLSLPFSQSYAQLCYEGLWHTLGRESLEAYFQKSCEVLSGTIRLRLEGGQILVTERHSPFSLYDRQLVSFEEDPYDLLGAAAGYGKTMSFSQWQTGRAYQTKNK